MAVFFYQTLTQFCDLLQEYSAVGAVIEEDLSEAELIIGVKSVPIDLLLPDKTYAFFSHTIKAQKDNMPLLDAIIEKVWMASKSFSQRESEF